MNRRKTTPDLSPGAPWPSRVIIENVRPEIDSGRFPVKRTLMESVEVTADIHADGHDVLRAVLRHRRNGEKAWTESPMEPIGNDRWRARFTVTALAAWSYGIEAWVDRFRTWRRDLRKKSEAGLDVTVELLVGAGLVEDAAGRAGADDGEKLREWSRLLRPGKARALQGRIAAALDEELLGLMDRWSDRGAAVTYGRDLTVVVDPERARFSSWYEMFPRSASSEPGRHGTFKDCEERLPYVAGMGFDTLYLPPIHPIGTTHRKGKNNSPLCEPADVGSPWAIGAAEGGHDAVHPRLGTMKDFRRLVARAREMGVEVAMDLALQCSPDHPWAKAHPEWFRRRPDGSIQFAENPPKRYEDIYPIEFETAAWEPLWQELRRVVFHWIAQGVRTFRVDNPHTKPFPFWEWLIAEVRAEHPDVVFLAEAFTRPKVMYQLAKLGFSQSYTYFAWRNTGAELREYLTELTRPPVSEFFRPNFWPNTPDILTEYLQAGGRPGFIARIVLAATLGASYGIYGPAYELCENRAVEPGREEYLNSEKYEVRHWDIERSDSLAPLITRINRIRRENPALQSNRSLRFHGVSNENLIAYSKATEDLSNIVIAVVNLDPHHRHSGFVEIPLEDLGLDPGKPYQVHDLISDARFFWNGPSNYVELDPAVMPAHVLRVRRRTRTERDFDYYL